MKSKSVWFGAAAVSLAVALVSCGGGNQQSNESAAPAASSTTAGKPVDPATAGTISGMIKLDGAAPRMRNINMAAEPNCAKANTGAPAMTQDVVVGNGGTLQNVLVYLKGDFSQYSVTPATNPIQIDQKGCQYTPHVVALMVNEPLEITNSDMTTHNIHPVPMNNREWNESQPPGASPIKQSFAREEVAIPVKCNVHPWMKAYIAVIGNPYFKVTGTDGSYTIQNVPPGTYTLTAWQETYGAMEQSITVGPSEKKTVDLTFKASAAGSN
jgi:hypothetical protein